MTIGQTGKKRISNNIFDFVVHNKPSEFYPNTLLPIPYPLYIFFKNLRIYIPNIYIYTLRAKFYILLVVHTRGLESSMSHRAALRTATSSGSRIGRESCEFTTSLKCSMLFFITVSHGAFSFRIDFSTCKIELKACRTFC